MIMEQIVKRYYDSLEQGKIMGRKCTRCGAVEFPPVLMCNACGCQDMEWVEVNRKGKMTSFAMPSMLSEQIEFDSVKPYCFATVEFEEGVGRNLVVSGVSKENRADVLKKLPATVELEIIQMDGFKSVVARLVE
jgi:uncharacterized OB-fold protein